MDAQTAINIAIALLGTFGGWMLKFMHGAMRDLQQQNAQLTDKLQKVEVLVAGEYVKRSYFDNVSNELFRKLDGIAEQLRNKVDRRP